MGHVNLGSRKGIEYFIRHIHEKRDKDEAAYQLITDF